MRFPGLLSVLTILLAFIPAGAGETSTPADGPQTYHLVVEQTYLFTRSRSWEDGKKPWPFWEKSGEASGTLEPWPEVQTSTSTTLRWNDPSDSPPEVDEEELRRNPKLINRFVDLYPESQLRDDFPGKDELLNFVAAQVDSSETEPLVPSRLDVRVTQTAYHRSYVVTLSNWRAQPRHSAGGFAVLASVAASSIPGPTEPLQPQDKLLRVHGIHLGMTADDYLALQKPSPHVRFRADQDTVVYASGRELKLGDQSVARGQPLSALIALLEPRGYTSQVERTLATLTNGRVSVTARLKNSLIESLAMSAAEPTAGDEEAYLSELTIYGMRPGATRADLLRTAGPAEEELQENGQEILRWGVWDHERGEIPGVRLEATLKGDHVERLRGDRVEQGGVVLLGWRTPVSSRFYLSPGVEEDLQGTPGYEEMLEQMDEMKYALVAYQKPDINRSPKRPGPERVLEFTDRGLSIWEYPGNRRQFQLVIAEPPTLGVDLDYP